MANGPLQRIKVVDAANYLTGPYAATMMADLGAEVVKVEPPGGDPFRGFGRPVTGCSAQWSMANRGKRNVVVDLKAGIEGLLELVRDADVFVSNWRPDVADRLGVGDSVLVAANPGLIRCWITGVGPTGPRALDPAFDSVAQALSGMTDAVARSDAPELTAGYPVDKITALVAVQAILAALLDRQRTGEGDRLDVSMLDAASYVDFPELLANRVFLDHEPPEARSDVAVVQRPLPASDGWFVIATVTGRQMKNACEALGHPEWTSEVFAQPGAAEMVVALRERFAPVTAAKPVAHWLKRFRDLDVPAARCLTIDEHLKDPQVLHNGIYRIEQWPGVGRVRVPRHPAVSARHGHMVAGPAPTTLPGA